MKNLKAIPYVFNKLLKAIPYVFLSIVALNLVISALLMLISISQANAHGYTHSSTDSKHKHVIIVSTHTVYTLYRNSLYLDYKDRYHIATFDSTFSEDRNKRHCDEVKLMLSKSGYPGRTAFWCEVGYYSETGDIVRGVL